jgi:hypothetical protein
MPSSRYDADKIGRTGINEAIYARSHTLHKACFLMQKTQM